MAIRKTLVIILVTVIILSGIVSFALGYMIAMNAAKSLYKAELLSLSSTYEKQIHNISAQLQKINETLHNLYSGYTELQLKYESLNETYTQLLSKYFALESDYKSLYSNYTSLLDKYGELFDMYANVTKILTLNVSEILLVENLNATPNQTITVLHKYLNYSGYLNVDILLITSPINITISMSNPSIGLNMTISKVLYPQVGRNYLLIVPVTQSIVTISVKNILPSGKNLIYIIISYRF